MKKNKQKKKQTKKTKKQIMNKSITVMKIMHWNSLLDSTKIRECGNGIKYALTFDYCILYRKLG